MIHRDEWPCRLMDARELPADVVPRGLGPRTLRLLAVRSNQLSYETSADMDLDISFYPGVGSCEAEMSG